MRRTLGLQFPLRKQRKSTGFCKYLHSFIDVSSKVTDALKNGKPVVALETTIITHGMPYPANLQTARNVEDLITRQVSTAMVQLHNHSIWNNYTVVGIYNRLQGSVPATIGVLQGRIKVGLDEHELQTLAEDHEAVKISRRDFPVVLNKVRVQLFSRIQCLYFSSIVLNSAVSFRRHNGLRNVTRCEHGRNRRIRDG